MTHPRRLDAGLAGAARADGAPRQLPLDLPHRASLARDDLIVTEANRMAVAAVDRWPDWAHPVLLVVGPAGSGKSHLAAAWAEIAGAVLPSPDVHETVPFAVVIDDVDRADGSEEEAVFGIVNAARLGGGSVLLTARARPADMALRLPDLRSRLKAATIAELGAPDDALLDGVLAKLFADRQMAVDPKLVAYAAARMERSLDAANRFVAAVDREALACKERISRHLLARVLRRPEFEGPADAADGTEAGGNDANRGVVADHDSEMSDKDVRSAGMRPETEI